MPSVKITKEVLKLCYYADVPLYLWAATASAKTALVRQVARDDLKIPVVSLYFQTQEPGDILGLPHVQIMYPDGQIEDLGQQGSVSVVNRRDGKKVTSWAAPEWFQFIMENPKAGIIFGDEANRAQPDTAQTFTCLITERRFHVHEVPPGWKFVFASNYGSEYDVRELDVAIMSRFCHLKVKPTVTEWLEWGRGKKATKFGTVHKKVKSFIESSPSHLVKGEAESSKAWEPKPNRRAWEWVSDILYAYDKYKNRLDPKLRDSALKMAVQGLVGPGIYTSLFTEAYIDVAAILKDPAKFNIKDINRFSRELVPVLIKTKPTPKLFKNLKELILKKCIERKDLCFQIARSILKSTDGYCEAWADMLRDDKAVKKFYASVRQEAGDTDDSSSS
jgi:hypothetical protein